MRQWFTSHHGLAPARVTQDLSEPSRRVKELVGELYTPLPNPDRIVSLGRLAGLLDQEERQSIKAQLHRLEARCHPKDSTAVPTGPQLTKSTRIDRDRINFLLKRAIRVAVRLTELGPNPDPEVLGGDLQSNNSIEQLAALHFIPSLRGNGRDYCRIFRDIATSHDNSSADLNLLRKHIRLLAARRLISLACEGGRVESLRELLDSPNPEARMFALQHAALDGPRARPVLLRALRSLQRGKRDEQLAAVIAINSLGLPARSEWRTRADFRRDLVCPDEAKRAKAREDLRWVGPREGAVLPILDSLGASKDKALAAMATRTAKSLRLALGESK